MRKISHLFTILVLSAWAYSDTLPPNIVKLKGATDNTPIGNVGDALKVTNVGGGSSTVNQGTPNTASNAWPMYICDGGGVHCLALNSDGSINVEATIQNPPTNYALETGGNIAAILAKLNSSIAVTGTFFQATQPVSGSLGRTWTLSSGTDSVNVGNFPASITNYALETGGHLASIDTKTPSLGQALAASSVPVVLTAAQITTLTPPTSVIANAGINLNTSALALSATQTNGTQTTQIVQAGNTAIVSAAGAQKVDGSAVTQPVSGSVTATQTTGTNLHTVVDALPTVTINPPLSTTGTFNTVAITAATSVSAPSNTTGVVLQALDTNTANIRYAFGSVASATNGMQLEPGRSEYIPIDAAVSLCPESGTQTFTAQWVSR